MVAELHRHPLSASAHRLARDHAVRQAIVRLDIWFQSMRGQGGYTGPIAHWWESSLLYSGPMADWRYEGILCGYVNLFNATGDQCWLDRAVQAANDIAKAQLPDGRYANSSFQQGPMEGGTPHEAAVNIGLLELAQLLRSRADARWQKYFSIAECNLQQYQIGRLWNGKAFLDQPWNTTMVANKNATLAEALVLYEKLSGNSVEPYIRGAAKLVLSAQVTTPGVRQGATIHLGTGSHQLAIGIYTARCAAALIRLWHHYGDNEYLMAATRMGQFLLRLLTNRGSIFGYYRHEQPIVAPIWISPSGDLMRALILLQPFFEDVEPAINRLTLAILGQQLPSGGIMSAYGLEHKGKCQTIGGLPGFRDVLPVVGWCDKSFRAFTMLLQPGSTLAQSKTSETNVRCLWKGRLCVMTETDESIQLTEAARGKQIYYWEKGSCYPSTYQL